MESEPITMETEPVPMKTEPVTIETEPESMENMENEKEIKENEPEQEKKTWKKSTKSLFNSIRLALSVNSKKKRLLTAALDTSSSSNDFKEPEDTDMPAAVDNKSVLSDDTGPESPSHSFTDMGDSKVLDTPPPPTSMGPGGDTHKTSPPRDSMNLPLKQDTHQDDDPYNVIPSRDDMNIGLKGDAQNVSSPSDSPRGDAQNMSSPGYSPRGDAQNMSSPGYSPRGDAHNLSSPRDMISPSGDFKRSPRTPGGDNQSAMSESSKADSNSSRPTSAASSRSPLHKERDPAKRAKDRDREERVRQTRERMALERRRKFEELKEQQRQAQENREKQLEMRRRKIAELRQREDERRAAVEERRKRREATDRARREDIISKAQERVARYEQWKLGGRKGPCPGEHPPSKQLSMSMSVLYHKRNPDFASSGMLNHRPDSMLALNTVPEGRRSLLAPPQRQQITVGLNSVKMRDGKQRKPRPASIASSMPSFMQPSDSQKPSPRSKSTDRLARDRPNRTPRKSLGSQLDKKEEKKEEGDAEKDKKSTVKLNRQSIERLSQPKKIREKPEPEKKIEVTPPTKKSPRTRISPRKSLSTTNLATVARKPTKSILKDRTKEAPAGAGHVLVEDDSAAMSRSAHEAMSKSVLDISSKATADIMSKSMDSAAMSKSTQDITVEEYKAKLAEKRRQAREKAEREAEIERERLEAERLAEEERQRVEEEEERRQEEESLRLAADARAAEEERLRKAIEAEEARKKEEAERLETERIAKEEAEKQAKEEAEKQEKERQEKKIKEEEERLERKKRLEMIMKRVKTDGSESPKNQSPAKSATSSPSKSGDSSTESSAEDGADETMTTTITQSGSVTSIVTTITSEDSTKPDSGSSSPRVASPVPSTPSNDKDGKTNGAETPKFRSPLLQQLVENKTGAANTERPKFKSPLLQNLLGKNKGKRGEEDKSEDKKAAEDSPVVNGKNESVIDTQSDSDTNSVKEQLKYDEASDEDKDVDTSEKSGVSGHRDSVDVTEDLPMDNPAVVQSATDSGIMMDLQSSSTSTVPGPLNGLQHNGDLIDSSISMKSVESVTTSVTEGGSLTESDLLGSQSQFEEIIDLSNKNIQLNCESRGENSEDLLNYNNLGEGSEEHRTPFIAFEGTSAPRQDVSDLLS